MSGEIATPSVDVVILTYNEALHIARAIESVRPLARRVFVVDSFSTDDTVAIAGRAGAEVSQHLFVSQAVQFNWALDTLPINAEWIFRLDADEVVGDDLVQVLRARLPNLGADVAGVSLGRRHIFMNRWIRHGGRFPLRLVRLWRRGRGRIEDRWMDEHVVLDGGRIEHVAGMFSDHNLNDLTFFIAKHNGYATREAIEVLARRYGLFGRSEGSVVPGSRQAAWRRTIKNHVYNKLPFWLASLAYFLFRYIVQLGFLDGRAGLIYHVLQGFWYRFLVGAKVVEFDRALAPLPDAAARRSALSRLTGHELDAGAAERP